MLSFDYLDLHHSFLSPRLVFTVLLIFLTRRGPTGFWLFLTYTHSSFLLLACSLYPRSFYPLLTESECMIKRRRLRCPAYLDWTVWLTNERDCKTYGMPVDDEVDTIKLHNSFRVHGHGYPSHPNQALKIRSFRSPSGSTNLDSRYFEDVHKGVAETLCISRA